MKERRVESMESNFGSKSSTFHYALIGRDAFSRNRILHEPTRIRTPLTLYRETRKATKIRKAGKGEVEG